MAPGRIFRGRERHRAKRKTYGALPGRQPMNQLTVFPTTAGPANFTRLFLGFSVDPWKVHLADLALQLEGGRSGHRKGTVPSTRQPLAYLQHSVDHILLRKPKRSFAATKAISGKPSFQTVNVTFPPCFGFFGTSRFKGNTSWKPQHSCSG